MNMPKQFKQLAAHGYAPEAFRTAYQFFRSRGITIGYSSVWRSWYAMGYGKGNAPQTIIVKLGLGAFIDYLDAPSQLLKAMAESGAEIRN